MDTIQDHAIPNDLRAQREAFYRDLNENHSEALWHRRLYNRQR